MPLKIAREMGLLYDSSLMADDEPYELLEDGEPTVSSKFRWRGSATTPPMWRWDRMTGARPYGGPSMVLDIFQRELEVAYEEGGLFQPTLHPHHVGHRSRIFYFGRDHPPGTGQEATCGV